jgi:hypothetical protein
MPFLYPVHNGTVLNSSKHWLSECIQTDVPSRIGQRQTGHLPPYECVHSRLWIYFWRSLTNWNNCSRQSLWVQDLPEIKATRDGGNSYSAHNTIMLKIQVWTISPDHMHTFQFNSAEGELLQFLASLSMCNFQNICFWMFYFPQRKKT